MTAPIETGPVGRQALLDQLAITDQDEKTIDGVIAAVNAQVILWKGAHDPWPAMVSVDWAAPAPAAG